MKYIQSLMARRPTLRVRPSRMSIMVIDVITNLISQSASTAGFQILESFSPSSATWPSHHLDRLILFLCIIIPIISQYNSLAVL